ncbi:MAG TPA: phosphatidate cytidylyltransferase [Pirellulales bacterium]|nr:phosphatidate cytidylyltransferase [Pirellulales bacterium]
MSPSAALGSPIFLTYLALAVALIVLGGIALLVLKLAGRNVDHAWNSYRGWLIMIPLVFGAIFLGREATIVFFTLLAIFGAKEFARATGLYRDWTMMGVVYLSIIACGIFTLLPAMNGAPGDYGMFMAWPVYAISAILAVPIVRNRSKGQLQILALAILVFIYIGWMFGHVAFLTNTDHPYAYLLYLLFAVELNDVAAFVCGRLFGRHPLRTNISPKKTWEGALGAVGFSLLLPWILYFSLPEFTPFERVLVGLIVGVGGQFGDLAISVVKRDVEVKDMGALLVGHGGILDRIDSLIFAGPLFFHMSRYFHGL